MCIECADQLIADHSLEVANSVNGAQPLSSGLPNVRTATDSGVTYKEYQSVNGGLPVSGTASGINSVVVYLLGNGSDERTYRLLVVSGQFSGMVRIPFAGENIAVSCLVHPELPSTVDESTVIFVQRAVHDF